MRRVLRGWSDAWGGSRKNLPKLARALAKMRRFALWRSWQQWAAVTQQRGAASWMRDKIRAVHRIGRKRRAFAAWKDLTASTRRLLLSARAAPRSQRAAPRLTPTALRRRLPVRAGAQQAGGAD